MTPIRPLATPITAAALLWVVACAPTSAPSAPTTQTLLVSVFTDLPVPKDMDRMDVALMGTQGTLERTSHVLGPQGARLPLTLAFRNLSREGDPLRVRALGYHGQEPVILAETRVRWSAASVTSVQLDLSYLCMGTKSVAAGSSSLEVRSACAEGMACRGGRCQLLDLPSADGPEAVEGSPSRGPSEGNSPSCWKASACFEGKPLRPPTLEGDRCILPPPVPLDTSPSLALVPVRPGIGSCTPGGPCYIPLSEGPLPHQWSREGSRILLPPAVCDGDVAGIVASSSCSPWTPDWGLCNEGFEPSSSPGPAESPPRPETSPPKEQSEGPGVPPPPVCRSLEEASREAGAVPVEGTVEGLGSTGLVLMLNREQVLQVPPFASTFSFPWRRPLGSYFEVSLAASPIGLYCALANGSGQVSLSGPQSRVRVQCHPRPKLRQLVGGGAHFCVLTEEGNVRCWGDNEFGQTGDSSPSEPIAGLSGVEQLAAGFGHTCARMKDTSVRCWGGLEDGSLGMPNSVTASIPGLSGVRKIAAGDVHTCALMMDDSVRCWGASPYGIAAGSDLTRSIPGVSGIVDLSSGPEHVCILLKDKTVRCWGNNALEQTWGSSPQTSIPGLSGVSQISAGYDRTCVTLESGAIRCWGKGLNGTWSDPRTDIPYHDPVQRLPEGWYVNAWVQFKNSTLGCVGLGESAYFCPYYYLASPSPILQIVGSISSYCVRTQTDEVLCWGLGNGSAIQSSFRPKILENISKATDISVSVSMGGAVSSDGTVRLWGKGTRYLRLTAPELFGAVRDVRTVAVGTAHACILRSNGVLQCIGHTGPGDTIGTPAVRRMEISGVVDVKVHETITCALLADSSVRCWGDGGYADFPSPNSYQIGVPGLSGVVDVAPGPSFACAAMADTTVRCWGSQHDSRFGGMSAAESIPGLSGVVEVAAGRGHVCARRSDGTVRCWGQNSEGQTAGSSTSKAIEGLSGVVQLRAGYNHTCARLHNGQVRCWGAHEGDQDGGSNLTKPVPFLEGVRSLAAGGHTSCAILCDGRVLCFGDDGSGQARGSDLDELNAVVPLPP